MITRTCEGCNGTGKVRQSLLFWRFLECGYCEGTGRESDPVATILALTKAIRESQNRTLGTLRGNDGRTCTCLFDGVHRRDVQAACDKPCSCICHQVGAF